MRRLLWVVPALLVGWFALTEAIVPRWLVWLGGIFNPGPTPLSMDLGNGLAVQAYKDTRPHVGKIMTVQKGLVLVQDGDELVEEGYGFGAPILIYQGQQYLSQHAEVEQSPDRRQIVKRFQMDTIDTWTEFLRPKYRPTPSLGTVVFTYTVASPGVLEVAADFTGLRVEPELAYLSNEQGAIPFTLYSDSAGDQRYFADYVDQWQPASAPRTCFTAEKRRVRFCVETEPGQAKYVGRERYIQYRWAGVFWLSWAGTDIELTRPRGVYRYRVVTEVLQ